MEPEYLTLTGIARRVVTLGYATTMSTQRVYQLIKDDPAWPHDDRTRRVGRAWQVPWTPTLDAYFQHRTTRPGRAPDRAPARSTVGNTSSADSAQTRRETTGD